MTPDEERNLSNNSNSTDDGADDHSKGFLISYAVIHFLSFLFCLLIVIYISIRLKKRAWDSPAKRFANFFNVCFALTLLCLQIYIFIGGHSDIVLFSNAFFSLANDLYFIGMYVALSLQIVTPFLPERLNLCAHKTHCVKFTEVTSHVLFLLLAIPYSVFNVHYYKLDSPDHIIYVDRGVFMIAFILSYSFLFWAFAFLMKFFKYHNKKKKGVKHMIIKLLSFVSILSIMNSIIIVLAIQTSESLFLALLLIILRFVYYLILPISVVSLNHPLNIWCCKCCFSSSRIPLLPVNDTEGQQTNPTSVDHINLPSYTVPIIPYEMSDCRSDYEQLV